MTRLHRLRFPRRMPRLRVTAGLDLVVLLGRIIEAAGSAQAINGLAVDVLSMGSRLDRPALNKAIHKAIIRLSMVLLGLEALRTSLDLDTMRKTSDNLKTLTRFKNRKDIPLGQSLERAAAPNHTLPDTLREDADILYRSAVSMRHLAEDAAAILTDDGTTLADIQLKEIRWSRDAIETMHDLAISDAYTDKFQS